ncbi:hypothetical protein HYH03_013147 [Edaphochlamys debaryana]|uniref:MYND-type domain-containing protein n=1 Tax=Edaphochlamys debaryana TaxID=47281 RepID=A0A835XNR3_9CHLO|nr:hypothetical protein HYH03_013147 [Edaphochlamys debaryana]|eukprot:KAG2488297.1 hypothetical protein HYH03_013147 [Edaphochlamys debaryana]
MPPRRNGRAAPGGPRAGPGGRGPPAAATGFGAATVSALPPALISGWLRLPAVAEGLLGPAAGAAGPAGGNAGGAAASLVRELEALHHCFAGLSPSALEDINPSVGVTRASAVAELCSHGGSTTALMRLLAATLRVAAGEDNAAAAAAGGNANLLQARGAVCELTVIRTHTLHALSRQIAAAAARLAGPGGGSRGEGAGGAAPAREALVEGARLVNITSALLISLTGVTFRSPDQPNNPSRDEQEAQACLEQCRSDLAAALQSSRVLDHAGRLLVLLLQAGVEAAAAGPGWSEAERRAVSLLRQSYMKVPSTLTIFSTVRVGVGANATPVASEVVADVTLAAVSSPGVRHAVTACALDILCAEDGGPAYGLTRPLLPAEAAAAMAAAATRGGGEGSIRTWRGLMGIERAASLLSAVYVLTGQQLEPPLGRRAAFAVLQRIGRVGVDQAQRLLSFPPAAPSAQDQLQKRVALLSIMALNARFRLLPSPPLPAGWEAQAAEWWRQVLAGGRYGLGTETRTAAMTVWMEATSRLEEAVRQTCADAHGYLRLPAEPPRDVAAALAGGLLPATEALLRRVGEDPAGPEAVHLFPSVISAIAAMCGTDGRLPFHVPASLLACGEPLQAASLVLTVGKALRRWDRSRLERARNAEGRVLSWLLERCEEFLHAATWGTFTKSLTPGALLGPQARVLRLVSLAAAEWLPALARLGEAALELAAARSRRGVDMECGLSMCFLACARAVGLWAPFCSDPCLSEAQAPGAEAEAGCSAAGPSAAAGSGEQEWRRFLISEVRPEGLLLGTLEAIGRDLGAGEQGRWNNTVTACSYGLLAMWDAIPCTSAAELRARRSHTLDVLETYCATGGIIGPQMAALARQVAATKASAAVAQRARTAELWPAELDAVVEQAAQQARAAVEPLAAVLLPPERAWREALPRRCSLGPACVNLAGDGEAGLALRPCTGCRAVLFCSRECQRAAMQAGHKEACTGAKGRARE